MKDLSLIAPIATILLFLAITHPVFASKFFDIYSQQGYPNKEQGKEPGQGKQPGQGLDDSFRVDCRFHSDVQATGVRFCSASALYGKCGRELFDLKFGVKCDSETIYSGPAQVESEAVADRISPRSAAFPALELPADALTTRGTYQSVLDIPAGRLIGNCYVKPIIYSEMLDFDIFEKDEEQ